MSSDAGGGLVDEVGIGMVLGCGDFDVRVEVCDCGVFAVREGDVFVAGAFNDCKRD